MSATNTVFHTATIEHQVLGPRQEMTAVAYNLQYTKPLVAEFVAGNPSVSTDVQLVSVRDHELVRVNLYGQHPNRPGRRLCAIGIGDAQERAVDAANRVWFDYHASLLFTRELAPDQSYTLTIRHQVPGMPSQRAATIGVAYDVQYLGPQIDAAIARNMPTVDEVHVVNSGDHTLMRVNLHGRHPLDAERSICVGGIADRHYRAMAAAEQAWKEYHASLLFAAQALGSE
jgi:hypothetical protein